MKIRSKIILFFVFLEFVFCTDVSSEKMLNAFTMGMDNTGLELALEIISNEEYSSEREFTLFILSEYFFHNAMKKEDITTAQRAFTFYSKFIREYPKSEKVKVVLLRIDFLNSIYPMLSMSGEYLSELYSESYAIDKLATLGNAYILTEDLKDISKTKMLIDTESSFQVANKYYDTIILNYPRFSVYGYYLKILSYLNYEEQWFNDSFMKSAGIEYGFNANGFKLTYEVVNQILDSMKEKHPNSNLTFDAHIMLARVLWNSNPSEMPSKRKKSIVKELLEYVLKNDKNIIGYRYLIAKEFVIRNL